jgi:D-3-phosphoglycerate dehydrogenase / 2-oxoglutarate reductase
MTGAEHLEARPNSTRPRVATIGHRFPDSALEAAVLERAGIDVDWLGPLSKPDALRAAAASDAVLLGTAFSLDADSLAALERCRLVVRYGVGVDNVDLAAAARRNITVCNVPDYGVEEVATHAIALLLAFARRLDVWPAAVREGRWGSAVPSVRLRRLSQTTLGVVGAGRIGRAVIERARGIWGRVVATDPIIDAESLQRLGAQKLEFDRVLADSDFITVHVPSVAETRGMIGADQFRGMKRGVVLVNCSRGDVIDEEALIRALDDGTVAGAGLDVFATEPPAPGGIVAHPKIWPTPHIAYLSVEAVVDLRTRAAEEAARVLGGGAPRYAIVEPARPAPERS